MYRTTFLFILIVLGCRVCAQNAEADAVVEKLTKEYRLNPDGSTEFRQIKQTRLLSYIAFHRLYGETFIVYNPEYQKLKINDCYTLMADGRKVLTPSNAFNEVLPRFAANVPVYNNLREMVVTHTGLEVGASIFLDYTISSKKEYTPAMMGYEPLAEASSVMELNYIIVVPETIPLNFRLFNIDSKTEIVNDGKSKSYRWKFRDIPGILSEANQPGESGFMPWMMFTTAKDMQTLYGNFTSQPAFRFAFNEEMRNEALKIKSEKNDELKTVLRIQDIVINEINLYPVPLPVCAFKVRTAEEVWKSNGGTETEKAILFCSLLGSLNINAEPAAIMLNYDPGMGSLVNIETVLVRVSLSNGKHIYLSVTSKDDQDYKYKLNGRTLLFMNPHKNLVTGIEETGSNQVNLTAELTLSQENKISGVINLRLNAASNPYFGLINTEKKPVNYLHGLEGEDVKDFTIKIEEVEKSELSFTVKTEDAFRKQGNYWLLELPQCEKGLASWHLGELPINRKNPFEIPWPLKESYEFSFEVPSNFQLVNDQKKAELTNQAGRFVFNIRQIGNKVLITKEIELERLRQGAVNYYADLRSLINTWNAKFCKELILKTN